MELRETRGSSHHHPKASPLPWKFLPPPSIPLDRIARRYEVRVWKDEEFDFEPSDLLATIELERGTLIVDGEEIARVNFESHNVTWVQKTADQFISGMLSFTADTLACHGIIYRGANEHEATKLEVFAAVPPSVYQTMVANDATSDGALAPGRVAERAGPLVEHHGVERRRDEPRRVAGLREPPRASALETSLLLKPLSW